MTDVVTNTKIAITWANITIAWMFAFFWLSQMAITMLALLIAVDTITGFTKAWINGEATSRDGTRGLIAKIYLLLIPISISSVGLIAGLDLTNVISWTLSMLAFAELYSIVANIYEIRTRKQLPEYDAVSAVIAGLLSIIKKIINDGTNK